MKPIPKLLKTLFLGLISIIVLLSIFFGYSDKSLDELKSKYAQDPSKFIMIDNMNVHYRDEGNTLDSLPIVLIHGTSSSLHTFDAWTSSLKNKKRVIRMDLPGFGLTGPFINQPYSIDNYVVFMEHFLSAKGIKKCILAGNSLGGEIAWSFTVKNPNRIDKLILIDAAGYPLESKSIPIAFRIAQIPVLNKLMTYITPRFLVKNSVENVYFDKTKVTESLVGRYFELTLRKGNRQALVDRMTFFKTSNSIQKIKNIKQPTLILWGEQDLLIPTKSAYHFHGDLPNSTLVILKNSGHVPMEESPKKSLDSLLSFLEIK